eukprot:c12665_g2_i1.p1 GENE.c12665_g2_i1~~c12665_g2_i1.p1  ORF type:complete len:276 (+),score=52.71 c12665_g2_i1:159-986(+)
MLRSLMETMVVDKAFIARISERPECAFNVQEVTLLYIRLFQEGMDSNFISLTTFIRLCGPKFVTKRLFVLMLEDAKALQIVQPKSSDPVVAGDCVSFEFFVCFVSFFSPNVPVEEKLKKSFRTFTLTNPEYISPADLQRFLKESLTDNRLVVPDYVLAAVVANTFRNAGVSNEQMDFKAFRRFLLKHPSIILSLTGETWLLPSNEWFSLGSLSASLRGTGKSASFFQSVLKPDTPIQKPREGPNDMPAVARSSEYPFWQVSGTQASASFFRDLLS